MFLTILIIVIFVGAGFWWFFIKPKPIEKPLKEPLFEEIEEPEVRRQPPPSPKKKENPSFIVSPKFDGTRDGYVFKNGVKGVGYYRDRHISFGNKEVIEYIPGESPHQTGMRSKNV